MWSFWFYCEYVTCERLVSVGRASSVCGSALERCRGCWVLGEPQSCKGRARPNIGTAPSPPIHKMIHHRWMAVDKAPRLSIRKVIWSCRLIFSILWWLLLYFLRPSKKRAIGNSPDESILESIHAWHGIVADSRLSLPPRIKKTESYFQENGVPPCKPSPDLTG